MLRTLESRGGLDNTRAIEIGKYAQNFVITVSRQDGVLMLRIDGEPKVFRFSPKAEQVWRVVRLLLETRAPDGSVELFPSALQQFNGDAKEFSAYIHSTGEKNHYRLMPYPKSGYQRG